MATSILNRVWNARRPATIQAYCYALRKYFEYCAISSIPLVLPINSISACCYFTYLSESNSKAGAIRTAYNALKWAHTFVPGLNKYNDPLDDNVTKRVFESCLRSIKPGHNIKAPLTTDLVRKIIDNLSDNPPLTQLRNVSILATAHNLLLRHDEISHVSCAHITESDTHFKFRIISSKTDRLRNGKDVFLAKTSGRYSASSLLSKYLQKAGLKPGDNHFLFGPIVGKSQVSNQKLSYASYRLILKGEVEKAGADPSLFGFHSCRSGGATDLATERVYCYQVYKSRHNSYLISTFISIILYLSLERKCIALHACFWLWFNLQIVLVFRYWLPAMLASFYCSIVLASDLDFKLLI